MRSSLCAATNAWSVAASVDSADHALYDDGPPQALAPMAMVLQASSFQQRASPISLSIWVAGR